MDYLQEHVFQNLPYPLKKMDQIVVPNKGTSAMENWGMMTFGYDYFLPLITSEMMGGM